MCCLVMLYLGPEQFDTRPVTEAIFSWPSPGPPVLPMCWSMNEGSCCLDNNGKKLVSLLGQCLGQSVSLLRQSVSCAESHDMT